MTGLIIIGGTDARAEQREVYFIEGEGTGLIKIGVSNCAHERLKALAANSPTTLTLLGVVTTDKAGSLERALHIRFASQRERGEWFRANAEISAYIAKNASIPPKPRYGPGGVRLRPGQARPLYSGVRLAG